MRAGCCGARAAWRLRCDGPGLSLGIVLLCIAIVLALAACGGKRLAPVEGPSGTRDVEGQASARPGGARTAARGGRKVAAYRVPLTYRVRPGDTLYAIAWHYGLDYRTVAALNGIDADYIIRPGQTLRLQRLPRKPAAAGTSPPTETVAKAPGPVPRRPTPRPAVAPKGAGSPAATASTTKRAKAPGTNKVAARASSARPSSKPESRKSKGLRWVWPTAGTVVATFSEGDTSRRGLEIAGKLGQPVNSAAGGTVVYAGSGLIGYGNLVIIKHNSSFLSAYGHNRALRVDEGERVGRGQRIADMGRRPGGDPVLHFEVRRDGKPVNPLSYLPGQ